MITAEDQRKPAVQDYLNHPDVSVDGLPGSGGDGVYPGHVWYMQFRCIHSPQGYLVNRARKAPAPRVKNKLNIKDDDQLSFATRNSYVIVDRQNQVEIKGHGTADRLF